MTIRTSYKNKNIVWKCEDTFDIIRWYLNNKLHRLDGPAVEDLIDFRIYYWIHGKHYFYKESWLIERKKYLK